MPAPQKPNDRTNMTSDLPQPRKRRGAKEPPDNRDKTRSPGTRTSGKSTGEQTLLQRFETGLWGLGVLALALLIVLSLASYHPTDIASQEGMDNWIGPLGAWVAHLLYSGFGIPAYLLAAFLLFIGTMVVIGRLLTIRPRVLIALMLILLPTQVLLQILLPGTDYFPQGGGGILGSGLDTVLEKMLARTGTILIAVVGLLTGISLLFGVHARTYLMVPWAAIRRMGLALLADWRSYQEARARAKADAEAAGKPRKAAQVPQEAPKRRPIPGSDETDGHIELPSKLTLTPLAKPFNSSGPLTRADLPPLLDKTAAPQVSVKAPPSGPAPARTGSSVPVIMPQAPVTDMPFLDGDEPDPAAKAAHGHAAKPPREFILPDLGLLDFHPPVRQDINNEALQESARVLSEKLKDFRIDGEVTGIHPGPVITLFEFRPGRGIKVAQIASLSKDLAMALSAEQVRVIAPIPGRDVVGIEIPNRVRETVYLRELIASKKYNEGKYKLPMVMGKDIAGFPVVSDLTKMPHLLIAGTTGSGKSVALHAFITSILYRRTPQEVKFLFVDPKMLELTPYAEIPHLLLPVVKEAKEAVVALRWAVSEMERRNRLMSVLSVPNISEYNDAVRARKASAANESTSPGKNSIPAKPLAGPTADELDELPYIVVVIDELADLMMVAGKQVEHCISRLAQMARAAGIHMMIATQNPTVKVVTGIIKANLPARVAFKVRTMQDSRVVLDQNGADDLLGFGDMLFLPPGSSALQRIHGAFVSTEERMKVVEYLRSQGAPEYNFDIMQPGDGEEGEEGDDVFADPKDDLYDQAKRIGISEGKISTSMLQRELGIGYNKAAVIMARMEKEGFVGPQEAAGKARVVLR